jgi:hypothetical protein
MRHISEVLDGYMDILRARVERNRGLLEQEIMEQQVQQAANEFHTSLIRQDNYDAFLYWLEANYPWLYEKQKYRSQVWRLVKLGR